MEAILRLLSGRVPRRGSHPGLRAQSTSLPLRAPVLSCLPVCPCWLTTHEEPALMLKPESNVPFFFSSKQDLLENSLCWHGFLLSHIKLCWSELLCLPLPTHDKLQALQFRKKRAAEYSCCTFLPQAHPTHCFFPFPFCIWAVYVTCTQEVLPVAGVGLLLLLLSFLLFPLCSCNSCLLGDHPSSFLFPHPTTSPYVALSRNNTALPEKEVSKPKYLHWICPDSQPAQRSPA